MAAKNGASFIANMPTEEVFTTPDRLRVEGVVKNALPLVYNGAVIDGFSLTFREGRVERFSAAQGEAALGALLDTDEGARYLGEAALVSADSPIAQMSVLFYNTLFDENAACHLALGSSYPSCIQGGAELPEESLRSRGGNTSLLHVDFMIGTKDLSIEGLLPNGLRLPHFPKRRVGRGVFGTLGFSPPMHGFTLTIPPRPPHGRKERKSMFIHCDYTLHTHLSNDCETPMALQLKNRQRTRPDRGVLYRPPGNRLSQPRGENLNFETYDKTLAALDRLGMTVRKGVENGLPCHKESYPKMVEELRSHHFDFILTSAHLVDDRDPYFPEYYEGGMTLHEALNKYTSALYQYLQWIPYDCYDAVGTSITAPSSTPTPRRGCTTPTAPTRSTPSSATSSPRANASRSTPPPTAPSPAPFRGSIGSSATRSWAASS